jgi:hypothetical protein
MIPRRMSLYGTLGRCVGRDWALEVIVEVAGFVRRSDALSWSSPGCTTDETADQESSDDIRLPASLW